jgi:cytosolic carboxypeptidase protein 2/3
MKEMVRKTLECREIYLFVDIHGHSREKNLFMYGCQNQALVRPLKATLHKEKILPLLMQHTMDWFGFSECNFTIQKCKEATGRVRLLS